MKISILLVLTFLMFNCSSTHLVDSWKNPDIENYEPYKVLVVGLTSDTLAKQQFEKRIKNELELRGYEAEVSLKLFQNTTNSGKLTEMELDAIEQQLIEDGFDTILLTKITGIEDKTLYHKDYNSYEETYRKFKSDYLIHQDIFYNPDYYEEYKIYKAETIMYCICPSKERELIWKGYINITDPRSIEKTVNDYVKLALIALEEEKLIKTKNLNTSEDTMQ